MSGSEGGRATKGSGSWPLLLFGLARGSARLCGTHASGRAVRLHIIRVDRMRRRHVEPVPLRSAEGHIGATLGQMDVGERLAFRAEHLDAVEILRLAAELIDLAAV